MKYMSDIIIHFYTGGVLLQTNQKPEEENEPELFHQSYCLHYLP